MRTFLVILLLSWLGGIFISSIYSTVLTLSLTSAATLFVVHRYQKLFPLAVASALLVLLGGVLGGQEQDLSPGCDASSQREGVVTQYPRISSAYVTYRVEFNPGCLALVRAERWPLLERGDRLELKEGKFNSVARMAENSPGYANYLRRQEVEGVWQYATVELVDSNRDRLAWGRSYLRQRLNQIFAEPTASILRAMVIGDKDSIPTDILNSVRSTGVAHVLAISGLHISLLTGFIILLLRLLPLSPTQRTLITLLLLWLYILLIGAPTSALRAGLFWSLALFSFRFALLSSLPTAVLLTATLILTFDPDFTREVSFQLSFAAVLGIFASLFLTKTWREKISLPTSLLTAALVSLGATLTTWPLISFHFGLISPLAVLANLLVVPVVPLILGLTIITLLVSLISFPLALFIAWLPHLLTSYLVKVSQLIELIPGAFLPDLTLPAWAVAAYYFFLFLTFGLCLHWQHRSWREIWV